MHKVTPSVLLLTFLCCPGSLPAQSQADLGRVTLQLRWKYEFQFAGFIAARELGFYREAGLDVELRELRFGMSVYEELISGRAQYAVGTTDALVERAEGTPVVALAAIFQHSPFVVISREDSGILSPDDLVGTRVSVYNSQNSILEAILQNEGIDPGGVDFVPYDEDYSRFVSGEVPSTTAMLTLQPYVFDEMGIPYTVMYPQAYGIDFYGNTLITLEEEVGEHPERVEAFMEASLRGWRYALDNPEETIEILLREYSPQVDRDLLEFEAAAIRELIQPDLIAIGHMNPGRWEHIANQYRELGIIEAPVVMDEFLYAPDRTGDISGLLRTIGILSGIILVISTVTVFFHLMNVRLRVIQKEKQEKIEELQAALSEIRTLRDMLPICAACKKVRNDEGYWEHVEAYISKHTRTVFSHGLCPDCVEDLYPGVLAEEASPESGPTGG